MKDNLGGILNLDKISTNTSFQDVKTFATLLLLNHLDTIKIIHVIAFSKVSIVIIAFKIKRSN